MTTKSQASNLPSKTLMAVKPMSARVPQALVGMSSTMMPMVVLGFLTETPLLLLSRSDREKSPSLEKGFSRIEQRVCFVPCENGASTFQNQLAREPGLQAKAEKRDPSGNHRVLLLT